MEQSRGSKLYYVVLRNSTLESLVMWNTAKNHTDSQHIVCSSGR